MIRIRASSLSQIMTEPKEKSEVLSVGAKTFLEKMAKEYVYSFNQVISGKEMDKGIIVEDEAIALYNSVFFTNHKKNKERKENDWVTGECDIFTGTKIIDIKAPWSLATFPATTASALAACKERGYDWQGRAYMMLWDVDYFDVAFCMVNTPDELIKFEQEELHYVDHIEETLRITIAPFVRDKSLEDKIKFKVEAANQYLEHLVEKIQLEHTV
jgi:hypothetical protein